MKQKTLSILSRQLVSGVVIMLLGIAWSSSAFGQMGYNPARGPISPWMNLFQKKVGPLDNYNSWVRPQIQLQDAMAQQNLALQQQSAGLQTLGYQVETRQASPLRPTGAGSVFMNYGHYYPSMGPFVPTRAHAGPRPAVGVIPGTRFSR